MTMKAVVTSIGNVTAQIKELAENMEVIVIGDKKSPKDYEECENVEYHDLITQLGWNLEIVDNLPCNHYSRKNLGYLLAMKDGVDCIYDCDDDTALYSDSDMDPFVGTWFWDNRELRYINGTVDWFNPYAEYLFRVKYRGDALIWPRGFPLSEVEKCNKGLVTDATSITSVAVVQGLVDKDPDVDAIGRMLFGHKHHEAMYCIKQHKFNNEVYILHKNNWTAFNSQNTWWSKDAFPYMYIPTTVDFRFTDILRSYVAQKCLWAEDKLLAYVGVTAYQDRNKHSLMADFIDEVNMHTQVLDIVAVFNNLDLNGNKYENLMQCYEVLYEIGVVKKEEFKTLVAWITDCKKVLA